MKKILFCILLCSLSVSHADSVSAMLQAKLNKIHSMSASFVQIVKTKRRSIHSSGTMALVRPGHFRWQTQHPMKQLVVADGKRLWVYDPDLEQVAVRRQAKGVGGTAGLFLSGYGNTVTGHFNVTAFKHGSLEYYELRPKALKSNFQQVRLTFDGPALVGIALDDQLGQHTEVRLSQVKMNVALAPGLFQFSAPKGVDVVQQ